MQHIFPDRHITSMFSAVLRSRSAKESEVFGWSRIPKNTKGGVGFFHPTATPEIQRKYFLTSTPTLGILIRAR